ncbi:hypothetical protein GPALN_004916 [Globodera pallida]|nr:hypothetical protein GPALN_004916 [Globodera pallida]
MGNQTSNYDKSPWLKACVEGNLDTVKHFVENGQDIEATDRNGSTGLMLACIKGNADVTRFLLSEQTILLTDTENYGKRNSPGKPKKLRERTKRRMFEDLSNSTKGHFVRKWG